MVEKTPNESPPPPATLRLNLLAFPTETNALFALLVLAAVMLAVQLSYLIYLIPFPNAAAFSLETDVETLLQGKAFAQTMRTMLIGLGIPAFLISLILGAAYWTYRGHPRRVRRVRRLEQLQARDEPIQKSVEAEAIRIGIQPPYPVVEMPRGNTGTSGQVFGFQRNYMIRLDGGLRIWRRIRPGRFRAIVLHELAHITNGDVWRSYFAEALWKAMIILSIAPVMLNLFYSFGLGLIATFQGSGILDTIAALFNRLPFVLSLTLQTVLLLGVIGTIRARLLQKREVYADWQAAVWGSADSLKDIFQEGAEKEKKPSDLYMFRLHPTSTERLEILNRPGHLFQLSWYLPFIVGFLLALVMGGITLLVPRIYLLVLEPLRVARLGLVENSLLFWVVRGAWFSVLIATTMLMIAPIAWLISGVLGSQLRKQIAANLVEGKRGWLEYLKLSIPAISLIAGLEAGFWVTPFSIFIPNSLAEFIVDILMIGVMTVLAWLFLVYSRFITLRLFASYTGVKLSRARTLISGFFINAWIFICFIPGLFFDRILISHAASPDLSVFLIGFGIWLTVAMAFGVMMIVLSWGIIKLLTIIHAPRCQNCGQITRRAVPAIATCEYCGHLVGKWLYVQEEN